MRTNNNIFIHIHKPTSRHIDIILKKMYSGNTYLSVVVKNSYFEKNKRQYLAKAM